MLQTIQLCRKTLTSPKSSAHTSPTTMAKNRGEGSLRGNEKFYGKPESAGGF